MDDNMSLGQALGRWSQRLLGIAQTGLAFATSPYDIERYEELLALAAEIAATSNARASLNPRLAGQLERAWRNQVQTGIGGYATPKVGVGAIVFNAQDELLLVHSTFRQDWCCPGGLADLGYAPSEVARKEALEEAGVDVTPLQLMGVVDSLQHGYSPGLHVYSLLFYCRLEGGEINSQTEEIDQVGFFRQERLPTPLTMDLTLAFEWHYQHRQQAYFD
jgi:ADP-ribose pyrophosphatase YjhB (NUDIX family)